MSDAAETMPPWKRELILRIRNKTAQQPAPRTAPARVRQPGAPPATTTCSSGDPPSSPDRASCANGLGHETRAPGGPPVRCNSSPTTSSPPQQSPNGDKMVQERTWTDSPDRSDDSDSSEELKYGPGIVSKLKDRYLSLTLREAAMKNRPSILNMRKATSLEHILDKDEPNDKREYQRYNANGHPKHVPSRYGRTAASRKPDVMKRARSVEYISNSQSINDNGIADAKPKRESLHEDMLNANRKEEVDKRNEINDIKTFSNNLNAKVNRPKRLQPMMTEKEKPPLDVVRQAKKMFERPEFRTKSPIQTGEVAAKVATFKEIIETKKPPLKQKPVFLPPNTNNKDTHRNKTVKEKPLKIAPSVPTLRSPTIPTSPPVIAPKKTAKRQNSLPTSPIPDVSLVEIQETNENKKSSLSETPDLIPHSSHEEPKPVNGFITQTDSASSSDEDTAKKIPQNQNLGNSIVFDFSSKPKVPTYLPVTPERPAKLTRSAPVATKNPQKPRQKQPPPLTVNVPITEPLKVEITKPAPNNNTQANQPIAPSLVPASTKKPQSEEIAKPPKLSMSDIVMEKNLKNAAKNSESIVKSSSENAKNSDKVKIAETAKNDAVSVPKVKKKAPRKQEQQNCLVFDFTARKDVPDYVGNDGRIKTGKIEKPKPGEGGFTLLPGATLDESLVDDGEDWKKSLEGPPSPLLVTFFNDNVLIDGKSSLSQKTKRPKMSIKFVEREPDVFEYPAESSIIGDESPVTQLTTNSGSVGHNVPSLSGSSLANYKSKTVHQIEDFQLGMKPTTQTNNQPLLDRKTDSYNGEEETNGDAYQPIAFSAGTNTDILF